MVNTKQYGDEHFEPKEGGMSVRPSAGPLPLGTQYVPEDTSPVELRRMWKSLEGQDPDTVVDYEIRKQEIQARMVELGIAM
jgi:hypothetical protein